MARAPAMADERESPRSMGAATACPGSLFEMAEFGMESVKVTAPTRLIRAAPRNGLADIRSAISVDCLVAELTKKRHEAFHYAALDSLGAHYTFVMDRLPETPTPVISPMNRTRLLSAVRWVALLLAGAGIGHVVKESFKLHDICVAFGVLAALAGGWRLGLGADAPVLHRRVALWLALPIAIWGLHAYLMDYFGAASVGGFLFHIQMGLDGEVDMEFARAAAKYSVLLAVLWLSVSYIGRRDRRISRAAALASLTLLLLNPFALKHPFWAQPAQALLSDDEGTTPLASLYVAPDVTPPAPEQRPNLILIYAESAERTFGDPAFGDTYAEFAALAARGIEFTGVRQIENTGWTIAGIVASQCGVPLMPIGMMTQNAFDDVHQFIPGVRCFSEMLADQGYVNSYIGGADLDFAGKRKFLEQHGYTRLLGEDEMLEGVPAKDINRWGLNDDRMFERAVDEVRALRSLGRPFHLSVLTLSAHFPNGFPARSCIEAQGPFDGEDILYSVRCTGRLVNRFIETLRAEKLLDDTIVVVMSDHLSMKNSEWRRLNERERRNTVLILRDGIAPRRVDRAASMLDLFPTLLELTGHTVGHAGRAGLGVSLLGPRPTLIESIGPERLDALIASDRELAAQLWQSRSAQR